MKTYKKMMIKKDMIMPLIETLANAHNNAEGEFIVIETEALMFVLFDQTGAIDENWIDGRGRQ